jgi:Cu(I)/Ag(I) efflux system membrane fusion protein
LVEGEQVVTNGNFKIDSDLQIRGRASMMNPDGGGQPIHDHGAEHEDDH